MYVRSDEYTFHFKKKKKKKKEAVPLMPKHLLASSTRVNSLRRPGDELVWRLRKPPDLAKRWLLIGGVNKIKDRRKEGCLPALWHTFTFPTLLVHHRAVSVAFAFLARRCRCSTFIFPPTTGEIVRTLHTKTANSVLTQEVHAKLINIHT